MKPKCKPGFRFIFHSFSLGDSAFLGNMEICFGFPLCLQALRIQILGPLILVAGFCLAPVAQQHQALWASDGGGRDWPFNRACSQLPSREWFFLHCSSSVGLCAFDAGNLEPAIDEILNNEAEQCISSILRFFQATVCSTWLQRFECTDQPLTKVEADGMPYLLPLLLCTPHLPIWPRDFPC